MTLEQVRRTSDNRLAAGVRILLAALFLMTGAMKLLVPSLADAFAHQLRAAEIPLYELSLRSVPIMEVAVGAALVMGGFSRVAAVVVMGIMAVATYVHLTVDDPSLFPLQPTAPVIPLVVLVLAAYVMWRGAGSWSRDLTASRRERSS